MKMGKKEIEVTGVIWVSSTFSTFVQNACPKTQTMKMTFTVKNAALMKLTVFIQYSYCLCLILLVSEILN